MIGVIAQLIMVVEVFPTCNNTVYPLPKHLQIPMFDLSLLTSVIASKYLRCFREKTDSFVNLRD